MSQRGGRAEGKSSPARVSGRTCVSPARPRRVAIIRCRMVRNNRPSWARYDSVAAVRADPACASTARTSQHVTTSVTPARRVGESIAGRVTTCRWCRYGRNRRPQAAGRGGYGSRESRDPRRRPSASRRSARKDAPVLRAAVGPPAVARSGDVRDRRARRLRDLPSLTDRVRDRFPASPVSLTSPSTHAGSMVSG